MAVCDNYKLDKEIVTPILLDIKESIDYEFKGQTKDLCNDCERMWDEIGDELKN